MEHHIVPAVSVGIINVNEAKQNPDIASHIVSNKEGDFAIGSMAYDNNTEPHPSNVNIDAATMEARL